MAGSLGTIYGQVKLDVAQAVAAFTTLRSSGKSTLTGLAKAGEAMTKVGEITAGAGLAMVGGFALAVKAAAEFDKKMSYIQGISHATGAEMDSVRNKALQLGRDGQFSAGQIADGFVELAKAGVSVTDMTHGMADAMVNLASAADVKLGTAVEDIIAVIHTYNLSTKDAAHVSDELAGTMHASVLSLNDVSASMKYAGSIAQTLGITFDQVSTAVAILGKNGIKGSSAGTQLRQIMVSLAGGSKAARKELSALGIITKDGANQFFDSSGKAKSLAQIFQILQDHTKGLTQQQQLMAFRTIFNNRALAAAEILSRSGAKGFAEMNKQIQKTTAAEVAGKRLDNLSGDIQKLKGSIDTALIKAGTPFQKFLRTLVQDITRVFNTFINLPSGVQTAILSFIAITGVILTLAGTFLIIVGTIFKAAKMFKELIDAFRLLRGVITIVTTAMRALSLSFLTNPVFLIVAAVIALGIAFYEAYKHSKTFRDIINAIGRGIKTGFLATIHWFEGLPKFFENLWHDITKWFNQGVSWVEKSWNSLVSGTVNVFHTAVRAVTSFGNSILNFFTQLPGRIASFISNAWGAFTRFLARLPYDIGYALGFALGTMVKWAVAANAWALTTGEKVITAVIDWFKQLPGRLVAIFLTVSKAFLTFTVDLAGKAEKFGVDVYHSVVNWFEKLPGRIESFCVDMFHKAVNAFVSMNTAVFTWSNRIFNDVVQWFEKLPGRVWSFVVDVWHKVDSAFHSAWSAAVNWVSNIVSSVADWMNRLPSVVWNAIQNVINAFENMVSSAFSAAANFADGLWQGFKHGLGINSPSLIEKQMVQITRVCSDEQGKLVRHVRTMQNLSSQLYKQNPANAASDMNTAHITTLTQRMIRQWQALRQIAGSVGVGTTGLLPGVTSTGATSTASERALESLQNQRPITVNINNPVAEPASVSVSTKLRTLSAMGAF